MSSAKLASCVSLCVVAVKKKCMICFANYTNGPSVMAFSLENVLILYDDLPVSTEMQATAQLSNKLGVPLSKIMVRKQAGRVFKVCCHLAAIIIDGNPLALIGPPSPTIKCVLEDATMPASVSDVSDANTIHYMGCRLQIVLSMIGCVTIGFIQ